VTSLGEQPRADAGLPGTPGWARRGSMSLESVRTFFAEHAPDIDIIVTEQSSATVALAAQAHGVAPEQIAKTICLRAGETVLLIVTAGTARLDNRKFKDRFGAKARMLDA